VWTVVPPSTPNRRLDAEKHNVGGVLVEVTIASLAEKRSESMGARLFVTNLAASTTEIDLHGMFSEGGREIREVTVVTDRATGVSRGFAFVEMANEAAAQQAMATLHGRSVQGKLITVNVAKERGPATVSIPNRR
jgi:RNA recognition motif-containing protein